jgi:hypothetical protein
MYRTGSAADRRTWSGWRSPRRDGRRSPVQQIDDRQAPAIRRPQPQLPVLGRALSCKAAPCFRRRPARAANGARPSTQPAQRSAACPWAIAPIAGMVGEAGHRVHLMPVRMAPRPWRSLPHLTTRPACPAHLALWCSASAIVHSWFSVAIEPGKLSRGRTARSAVDETGSSRKHFNGRGLPAVPLPYRSTGPASCGVFRAFMRVAGRNMFPRSG